MLQILIPNSYHLSWFYYYYYYSVEIEIRTRMVVVVDSRTCFLSSLVLENSLALAYSLSHSPQHPTR